MYRRYINKFIYLPIYLTCASPSWRGFIKAEEIARLNAIFSKARRFGYLPTDFHPLDDLLDASDESLFTSTRYNPQHVLHQLLPPSKQISYNLRSRGHGLTLSAIHSEFMRKNFLYRMLYNDIYINVKTCVIFFADTVVYIVCLLCWLCVCHSCY